MFWIMWAVPCAAGAGVAATMRQWDWFWVGVFGVMWTTLLAWLSFRQGI
jgi:hypothetical protein